MGLRGGIHFIILYFADDQVVVAEDKEDLSYIIRKLQEKYKRAGLTINFNKCECLIVCRDASKNLPLETGSMRGMETRDK